MSEKSVLIRRPSSFASNAKFPPSGEEFCNDCHYGYTCAQYAESTKQMMKKYHTNLIRVHRGKIYRYHVFLRLLRYHDNMLVPPSKIEIVHCLDQYAIKGFYSKWRLHKVKFLIFVDNQIYLFYAFSHHELQRMVGMDK